MLFRTTIMDDGKIGLYYTTDHQNTRVSPILSLDKDAAYHLIEALKDGLAKLRLENKEVSSPKYYFAFVEDAEGNYYQKFIICEKKFWDKNGYIEDRHIRGDVKLPDYFTEVEESIFDCSNIMEGMSEKDQKNFLQRAKQDLINWGLIENNELEYLL